MTFPVNNKYNDQGGPYRKETGYLSGTYTAATDVSETTASASTNASAAAQARLAAGVLTITVGFRPKHVKITNVTDRVVHEWYQGMNQGDYLKQIANGTKTLETDDKLVVAVTAVTPSATAAVTVLATGVVTVLADGGIITDNDTVVYEITG